MKQRSVRILACFVVFTMLFGMMPAAALAGEGTPPEIETQALVTEAPAAQEPPAEEPPAQEPEAQEPPAEEPAAEEPETQAPETEAPAVTQAPATETSPTVAPEETLAPETSVSPEASASPEASPASSATPEPEATPLPTLEGFELRAEETGLVVTRYFGDAVNVTVPATVGDWPVFAVDGGAFADNAALLSVELADGIIAVRGGAFSNCASLTSVILPASIGSIAPDAIVNCPLAVPQAPADSVAGAFVTAYAAALAAATQAPATIAPQAMMPEALGATQPLSDVLNINPQTDTRYTLPIETEAQDVSTCIYGYLDQGDDYFDMEAFTWSWTVNPESEKDYTRVRFDYNSEYDSIKISVDLFEGCSAGDKTYTISATNGAVTYTYSFDITVVDSPSANFDDVFNIRNYTDGNKPGTMGVPAKLYLSDAKEGSQDSYSGNIELNENKGVDYFLVEQIEIENNKIVECNFDGEDDGTYFVLVPLTSGTTTLHISLEAWYGENKHIYSKDYTIEVVDGIPELPTLTITSTLEDNRFTVGNETTGGVNQPFEITYALSGNLATEFGENVVLRPLTRACTEQLVGLGGNQYSFKSAGIYAVRLDAEYSNLRVSQSFIIVVRGENGIQPTADFDTYFESGFDPDHAPLGMYFVPGLSEESFVGKISVVSSAPFTPDMVSYNIEFLNNEDGGTVGIPCATVRLDESDERYSDLLALPNTQAGASAGTSRYRLIATVHETGKADVTYSKEFYVCMLDTDTLELPFPQQISLTASVVKVDYNPTNTYTLNLPGIVVGAGYAIPVGTAYLQSYNPNGYWDFWGDIDEGSLSGLLSGKAYRINNYSDRQQHILLMRYTVRYANLTWRATFKLMIGVGENDATQIFDVNTQIKTVMLGGLSDNAQVWVGSVYGQLDGTVTAYSAKIIYSADTGLKVSVENDVDDDGFTQLSIRATPTKVTSAGKPNQVRLYVQVNGVVYTHDFYFTVASASKLPTTLTLTSVSNGRMTVKAGEKFSLPQINEDLSAFDSYGWSAFLNSWDSGVLLETGDEGEHGAASEGYYYSVSEPGRYKIEYVVHIGANYVVSTRFLLIVTDEDGQVVLQDISDHMETQDGDDPFLILLDGYEYNHLKSCYIDNLQLDGDVTEEWSFKVSADSNGKFSSYRFENQGRNNAGNRSWADLAGMFPIGAGTVKLTIVYDAYEGTGSDPSHIYHGETSEFAIQIVDTFETYDLHFVGKPKIYYANSSGFVHIDALPVASGIEDTPFAEGTIRNEFGTNADAADLTYVNDEGETDWDTPTGCNFQIDPTQAGAYIVWQYATVSSPNTDQQINTSFRVVVGGIRTASLTMNEADENFYILNLQESNPGMMWDYFWVDAAIGEKLTWKLTRTKGTSVDLVVVNDTGDWSDTKTGSMDEYGSNNDVALSIVNLNGVGTSTFVLQAKLVTIDGKTLTANKTFTINVVSQENSTYLPALSAAQRTYTAVVGQTVTIPKPTITIPAGTSASFFTCYWHWNRTEHLNGYADYDDQGVTNLALCPMEPGYYTVDFEATRGTSVACLDYTLIVRESAEAEAPAEEPQLVAQLYTGDGGIFYDTDNNGEIELSGTMKQGVNIWDGVANISLRGYYRDTVSKMTFALEAPDTGVVEARIAKPVGDSVLLCARYTKAIGDPCTFVVHALVNGIDTGKKLILTLSPPRVPREIDDMQSITLSVGMTAQLSASRIAEALGQAVTGYSRDYDGMTAAGTGLTVSSMGLVTVNAKVTNAYVYAETADAGVLARVRVNVTDAPATVAPEPAAVKLDVKDDPVTLAVKALDAGKNEVPTTFTATVANIAIATVARGDDGSTFVITPVGIGATTLTVKTHNGKTVAIPVTVTSLLAGVTLSAQATVQAGQSCAVSAAFEPENASNKTLVWSWGFADGQDSTGFDSAWISVINGVLRVSGALDRVTNIVISADPAQEGVDTATVEMTLLPLATGVTLADNGKTMWVDPYNVVALSDVSAESPIVLTPTFTPADIAPAVNWTSSAPAVATVQADGTLNVRMTGNTVITATAQDGSAKKAEFRLSVRKFVTEVVVTDSLAQTSGDLVEGATLALKAACLPLDASNKSVTWSASQPFVNVTNTGVVSVNSSEWAKLDTPEATHTATVAASCTDGTDIFGAYTLTVHPRAAKVSILSVGDNTVTDTQTALTLDFADYVGTTATLALGAEATPDKEHKTVAWSSANPKAARVDKVGDAWTLTLLGNTNGVKLTATATDGSGVSDFIILKIVSTLKTVTVTGTDCLAAGKSAAYTATVLPAGTADKTVTWAVGTGTGASFVQLTNNGASITQSGLLSIRTATGTLTVRATSKVNKAVYGDCEVSVTAAATGVTVVPDETTADAELDVGSATDNTLKLRATVAPKATAGQGVIWKSSNTAVATVETGFDGAEGDQQYGLVKAVAAGTATITATAADGSNRQGSYPITVRCYPSTLKVKGATALVEGSSTTFTAAVTPAKATLTGVKWMFCDETGAAVTPAPTAAQLTQKGVLTGRAATDATDLYVKAVGTYLRNKTTETVESEPYRVTIYQKAGTVTIVSLDEGGTQYDPPRHFINLDAGDTALQLGAGVTPASAMQGVTWSSSNPKIATVSQTGLVTPLALGTVTVTATSADGLKKSEPYSISIGVPVSGLSIAASATTLVSNAKCTLTATLAPANATFKTVGWTSSNTSVATVTGTGVVTARSVNAASEVTITATALDGSGATDSLTLTVCPLAGSVTVKDQFGFDVPVNMIAKLNLNVSSLKSIAFSAACTPADALQTVTWSSSNPGVATVAGGVVTAVKNGTAVIKATAADGSGKSLSFNFQVVCLPESVAVSGPDSVALGKKATLKATVGPTYVSAQSVTWALDKASTAYASIDAAGVLTAKNTAANAGKTVTVYATTQSAGASGRKITSAAFNLTLTSPTASVMTNFGVGSVKASAYLYQRQLQLSAVCQPASAAQNVVWSSSDTKIAKVDQAGMVTFAAAGKVNITVTAADGTGVKTVITLTLAN